MPAPFDTITVRGTDHLVEQVKAYAHVIPVHFVLHDSRGRSYLVVPSRERPALRVGFRVDGGSAGVWGAWSTYPRCSGGRRAARRYPSRWRRRYPRAPS